MQTTPLQTKSSKAIKEAFNWLFRAKTATGIARSPSCIKIDFFFERNGIRNATDQTGLVAEAKTTTNWFYSDGDRLQALPLELNDYKKLTIRVHYYLNGHHYFELKDFDFTKEVLSKSNGDVIPIMSLFRLGVAQYEANEPQPVNDPSQFRLVEKGKSKYKVFDHDGVLSVVRADNNAALNAKSPHTKGIIKLYLQQKEVEG